MNDRSTRPNFLELGISAADMERLMAGIAVIFVRCIVGGLRWMKGEGSYDERVDPMLEKMLDIMRPYVGEQLLWSQKAIAIELLDDLIPVYRRYMDGSIATQTDLREIVRNYFKEMRMILTPGQIKMFAATRETITSQHGGPAQFAKYALGRFLSVHWKTIHTWSVAMDRPVTDRWVVYGTRVTPEDVRTFIDRYAEHDIEYTDRVLKIIDGAHSALQRMVAEAAEGAIASTNPVGKSEPNPGQQEARAASIVARTRRVRGGPGRPRKHS